MILYSQDLRTNKFQVMSVLARQLTELFIISVKYATLVNYVRQNRLSFRFNYSNKDVSTFSIFKLFLFDSRNTKMLYKK